MQLAEKPRIFNGNDGLVGKRCRQLNLFPGKRLRHGFRYEEYPRDIPLAQERNTKRRPIAADLLCFAPGIFTVGEDVGQVNQFALSRGPPNNAAPINRDLSGSEKIADLLVHFRCMAKARTKTQDLVISFEQPSMVGFAKPGCRLDKRVEHRLQIKSRPADNLEHVGGGRLLLQRLAQLIEQARILDGYNRLCGEIRNELNLLVAECEDLLPINTDDADQLVLFEHRHRHDRPVAAKVCTGNHKRIALAIRFAFRAIEYLGRLLRLGGTAESAARSRLD